MSLLCPFGPEQYPRPSEPDVTCLLPVCPGYSLPEPEYHVSLLLY